MSRLAPHASTFTTTTTNPIRFVRCRQIASGSQRISIDSVRLHPWNVVVSKQQQQQQERWMSSSSHHKHHHHHHKHHHRRRHLPVVTMCPFQTLGLQRTDELQFVTVKQSFLKIAMQHHPDTSKSTTKEEQELDKEKFVAARHAFEMIVEGPNGMAILKSETDEYNEEAAQNDDLSFWFQQETGHAMPYMDAATMREVAQVTESMGGEFGGLDRDGGMWTLARMVSQRVKEGGDANEILQLEAGKIRDPSIDGVLRRRRRR
jgi:hypothetical protein